jgi:hypothetical protein
MKAGVYGVYVDVMFQEAFKQSLKLNRSGKILFQFVAN